MLDGPLKGRCEVVCYTPDHNSSFAELSPQRVHLLLEALIDQTTTLGALPGVKSAPRAASWRDQVQYGLVNLGWPARDADLAIAAVEEEGQIPVGPGGEVNVATVLRAALRKLGRQR